MDTTQASMQTELIKHRHTLAVVGMGAIVFGIWSLIKSILYFVLVEPLSDIINENLDSDSNFEALAALALSILIVGLFVLIDMLFRWKVGRRAMAISRGDKDPGVGFFILSAILLLMDLSELVLGVSSIVGAISSDEDMIDRISTLLVDFTSVVMLAEMIFAAVMIRKLTKAISDVQNTVQHSSGAA